MVVNNCERFSHFCLHYNYTRVVVMEEFSSFIGTMCDIQVLVVSILLFLCFLCLNKYESNISSFQASVTVLLENFIT